MSNNGQYFLVKAIEDEKYCFIFRLNSKDALFKVLDEYAANPDLNFRKQDAEELKKIATEIGVQTSWFGKGRFQ